MELDKENILNDISVLISNLEDIEVVKEANLKALKIGATPSEILSAISSGLERVGTMYENGDYFLSELIMSGIIASEVSNILKPYLKSSNSKSLGKMVIGTVIGDMHDIGKNIVATMLSASGFEIIDLGVNVPSTKFIESIRKEKPNIVGMSCLLTIAMDEMKNVIDEIKRAGLREKVKILVGGRPISKEFAEQIDADAYASNAIEAVKITKSLIKNS